MLKSPLVLFCLFLAPVHHESLIYLRKKTLLSSYCRDPFVTFDTAISRA